MVSVSKRVVLGGALLIFLTLWIGGCATYPKKSLLDYNYPYQAYYYPCPPYGTPCGPYYGTFSPYPYSLYYPTYNPYFYPY